MKLIENVAKIFVNNLMECKMCKKNIQVLKKMGSGESGHMSESRFSLGWQKKGVSLVLILGVYVRPSGMVLFFYTDLLHGKYKISLRLNHI